MKSRTEWEMVPNTDVLVCHDVMVPMRDGVQLATDIYRPNLTGGPLQTNLPVLLERTPYDKRGTNPADRTRATPTPLSKPQVAAAFAQAGYIVAVQDCRGRYGSEGVFAKYVTEADDGWDAVRWLKNQPWCNGRIGTYGLSYGAHAQAALASLGPPEIGAMFLDSGGFSSAFETGIRQGGAFELKQATWAYRHALLSPEIQADPVRRKALADEDIAEWFGRMPWRPGCSPLSHAPEYEEVLFEQWRNERFSTYWQRPGLYARGFYDRFADIPAVHLCGWYDPYAKTAVDNFVGTSGQPGGCVRLLLGPWTHGQRSVTYAGNVDFGPHSTLDGEIAPDYLALRIAWFDRHLKGLDVPDYLANPVKLFVMGGGPGGKDAAGRLEHGGYWLEGRRWPLPGLKTKRLYLNDAGLCDETGCESVRTCLCDPTHPVPTIGGATASGAPVMVAGAFDQCEADGVFGARRPYKPLAQRQDVLVFESAPLAEPVALIGAFTAVLFVSSSAIDADVMLKLIDVYPPSEAWPKGFAMNLCHGVLRLRFRDSFEYPSLLEPDRVYKIEIEGFPTANHFAVGHRIRLDISGSNFPHFDLNPHTGESAGAASYFQIATLRIHTGTSCPSQILLPVHSAEGQ
ncbi:MAG: CocE/NonD family hydrolase [Alphaproteobacteria bacterium]|nr:CocE/NonD family hydrolase [Alphaproteobacteria bacterium]